MKILNVGCGGTRPQGEEWVNLDELHSQLPIGTPERAQLDSEVNYIQHDIFSGPLPFNEKTFDAILLSHCLEHFDAQHGVKLLQNCLHVLKPYGHLLVSVPDASYFRQVDSADCNENWPRLFGVTDPKNPIPTWRSAALFFEQHPVILTEDALWCYFREAGFPAGHIVKYSPLSLPIHDEWTSASLKAMMKLLNRLEFSLVMSAMR